jgi:uncharacterized YigZ family protein
LDHYQTIAQPAIGDFRDRGSKFFAFAYPISGFVDSREKLAFIKKEHPKATHHCFAYRAGADGSQFRVSDDGEPPGTAGRPILGQIDSRALTQVLVIVVRYFGGTQLGIPGLIHAYKTSAALALDNAHIITKPILTHYLLEFEYTRLGEVMRLVRQLGCEIIQQEQQLFCRFQLGVPRGQQDPFEQKCRDLLLKAEKMQSGSL